MYLGLTWRCVGNSTLLLLIVHALTWSLTLLALVLRKSSENIIFPLAISVNIAYDNLHRIFHETLRVQNTLNTESWKHGTCVGT